MAAILAIPDHKRFEAVLIQRTGLGWAVGVGRIVDGQIDRERSAHLIDRDAAAAALVLSDRFDLLVFRSHGDER